MRITGGEGKGRRLSPPPKGTRPTTGRVREVLFQLLPHSLQGYKVLDLFAGAGMLGLEALARGAHSCTFVESNRAAVKIIHNNITLCKMEGQSSVLAMDVFKATKNLDPTNPFDLIFADPPYGKSDPLILFQNIESSQLLANEGILVFETSSRLTLELNLQQLGVIKDRLIGDTRILLLGKTP